MDTREKFAFRFATLKYFFRCGSKLFFFCYSLSYIAKSFRTISSNNIIEEYLFFPNKICSNEEVFTHFGSIRLHNSIYQKYYIKNNTACVPDNLIGTTVLDPGAANRKQFFYPGSYTVTYTLILAKILVMLSASSLFIFVALPRLYENLLKEMKLLIQPFKFLEENRFFSFLHDITVLFFIEFYLMWDMNEIAFIASDNELSSLSINKNVYMLRDATSFFLLDLPPSIVCALIGMGKVLAPALFPVSYMAIVFLSIIFYQLFYLIANTCFPVQYLRFCKDFFQYIQHEGVKFFEFHLRIMSNALPSVVKNFFSITFSMAFLLLCALAPMIFMPLVRLFFSLYSKLITTPTIWEYYRADLYALIYFSNPFTNFPVSFFDGSALKSISLSLNIIFILKKYVNTDVFELSESLCARLLHNIQSGCAYATSSTRYYEARYFTQRVANFFSHTQVGGQFELIEANGHDEENEIHNNQIARECKNM